MIPLHCFAAWASKLTLDARLLGGNRPLGQPMVCELSAPAKFIGAQRCGCLPQTAGSRALAGLPIRVRRHDRVIFRLHETKAARCAYFSSLAPLRYLRRDY